MSLKPITYQPRVAGSNPAAAIRPWLVQAKHRGIPRQERRGKPLLYIHFSHQHFSGSERAIGAPSSSGSLLVRARSRRGQVRYFPQILRQLCRTGRRGVTVSGRGPTAECLALRATGARGFLQALAPPLILQEPRPDRGTTLGVCVRRSPASCSSPSRQADEQEVPNTASASGRCPWTRPSSRHILNGWAFRKAAYVCATFKFPVTSLLCPVIVGRAQELDALCQHL